MFDVYLTHWGRVMHICISKIIIISSDYGLSPSRHQAIFWTNAVILSILPLATNFSEMLIKIYSFLFEKMHVKMLSAKIQPFCLGYNVLKKKLHKLACLFIDWNSHEYLYFYLQWDSVFYQPLLNVSPSLGKGTWLHANDNSQWPHGITFSWLLIPCVIVAHQNEKVVLVTTL